MWWNLSYTYHTTPRNLFLKLNSSLLCAVFLKSFFPSQCAACFLSSLLCVLQWAKVFLLLLLNVAEIIQMCLPVCFFICVVCKQSLAKDYKDVILYSLHETVLFSISLQFILHILITHLLHIIYATHISTSHYF